MASLAPGFAKNIQMLRSMSMTSLSSNHSTPNPVIMSLRFTRSILVSSDLAFRVRAHGSLTALAARAGIYPAMWFSETARESKADRSIGVLDFFLQAIKGRFFV